MTFRAARLTTPRHANRQLAIGNRESAILWWTWHDLNVRPRPSQSRALIPLSYRSFDLGFLNADCGFEINLHSAIINRLAEGTGLEPASDKCAVVFKTTALPVRLPFQKQNDLWSSFLNFETFRTQMGEPSTRIKVLRSKYKVLPLGACDRTRTHEGQSSPPDLQSGAF